MKLKDVAVNDRRLIELIKAELLKIPAEEREKRKSEAMILAKKELIKQQCYAPGGLYFFADKIMGVGEWTEWRSGRKRLDPNLHGRMCRELERDDDTLQLYPRNHMKSTMLKIWICLMILKNPEIRIALFSKTRGLGKKQLKSIKAMLDSALVREIWGVPEKKKWEINNSTQLVMQRAKDSTIQEVQLEIFGIDNTLAGNHFDYHAYDDIVDDKTVKTASQIEKVIDAWEMLQVVKDKGAKEKMVGTRYHLHDIYGHIIRKKLFKESNTIIVRSRHGSGKPVYALYTSKDLDNLKALMGDAKYATQMDNDPVAASDKIFVGPYPLYDAQAMTKIVPANQRVYYASMDPAATANQYSDQTGISIGFIDKRDPRVLFLERSYGVRMKSEKLAEEFIKIQLQYSPKYFGIESGLQSHLRTVIQLKVQEWERVNKRGLRYKILPISTGNTSKAVKFSRILSPFLNDRRLMYPAEMINGQLLTNKEFDRVIIQLDCYNPMSNANDDDIIDSQNMVIQCVEHFSQGHWFGVEREKVDEGVTFESIYKQFYKPKKNTAREKMLV